MFVFVFSPLYAVKSIVYIVFPPLFMTNGIDYFVLTQLSQHFGSFALVLPPFFVVFQIDSYIFPLKTIDDRMFVLEFEQ